MTAAARAPREGEFAVVTTAGTSRGGYIHITQLSTDAFAAYPEAVDLAFGPYAKYGQIKKDYRNPLSCHHSPGMGLDFLLEIHDRNEAQFVWGACRDRQIRTPPALSPQECCETTAAHHKQGAGSYSRIFGAGF